MTIPLTCETLEAGYEYLRTTPPFRRWKLPPGAQIKFKVAKDPHTIAWHDAKGRGIRRRHLIAVSSRCVGHTISLLIALAHEMSHLHQTLSGKPVTHGAQWQKLVAQICKHHGFDPKAF